MTARTCAVGLNSNACTAPPGGKQSTQGTCFACGQPACTADSKVIRYLSYGRRRICADCIEQMNKDEVAHAAKA